MNTRIIFNKKCEEIKREKIDCKDSGIKATVNLSEQEFYFYTIDQQSVENAMDLMGYGSRDYNLSFFKDIRKPVTIWEELKSDT